MENSVIGAILAAAAGGVLAYINYRLTSAVALQKPNQKDSAAFLSPVPVVQMLVPVVRMLLSVGYLALLYFFGKYTPWDPVWLLAGGAAGLTLPGFVFTSLLIRALPGKGETDETADNQTPKGGNA